MQLEQIYTHIDHTVLKQTTTWAQVQKLCDEAISGKAASVCIPPCYVAKAKAYVNDAMPICTVIG
ncbi:MAG: 2-deoxyribose-5-phosphate aldolase, partial [Peptococcaceae bacterium]|nr:2-deoxyribose-5-phosphate aldolase [Peptococcaceae bacterium]